MIQINTQFSIIIFSLLYGLFFYYLLFLCRNYINYPNIFYRFINTFTFFTFLALVYFIGIEIVCDGILHIYSFIIIFGVCYVVNFIANKKK